MSNPSHQNTRFSNNSFLVAALVALALGAGNLQAAPVEITADDSSFSWTEMVRGLIAEFWPCQDGAEIKLENLSSRSELDSEIEVDPPPAFTTENPEKGAPTRVQR